MVMRRGPQWYWILLVCLLFSLLPTNIYQSVAFAQNQSVQGVDFHQDQAPALDHLTSYLFTGISAITLVNFGVEYDPDTDEVVVLWETATELDTAGYVIWRADTEFGTYEAKSPFILALGGLTGMVYEWVDQDVQLGNVYYYKLEEINTNNESVGFYGPVMFDYFSPTATATATYTPTKTGTITVVATTPATPTATRTPTATYVYFPLSPAPSSTSTLTPAASATAPVVPEPELVSEAEMAESVTLQPLPAFQLLFPEPTATPERTEVALLQGSQSEVGQAAARAIEVRPTMTSRIWVLGGIVFLLWIVLGAFLVLYLRKAQG